MILFYTKNGQISSFKEIKIRLPSSSIGSWLLLFFLNDDFKGLYPINDSSYSRDLAFIRNCLACSTWFYFFACTAYSLRFFIYSSNNARFLASSTILSASSLAASSRSS